MTYTKEDCIKDTNKHIDQVRENLELVQYALNNRWENHDKSKLEEPELSVFTKYTPLLSKLEYNKKEYKEALKGMGVALDHHYAENSHHPQHFPNGIKGMNLIDIVEMFCDWKASSERTKYGDIRKSIHMNKDRFGLSSDLEVILLNTVDLFEEMENKSEKCI